MNPNPTDSDGRPMVEGADYLLNGNIYHYEYRGQENNPTFGWSLRFELDAPYGKGIVYRPVNFHPTRIEGQAGGRRKYKSKSKRRKTKRRKSRKNKSRRRRR